MTKPISVRLEESVIQLLKERAKEAGVSQADYLTGLITSDRVPVIEPVTDAPVSSFNDPAREARKVEKRERKARLQDEIKAALPANLDVMNAAGAVVQEARHHRGGTEGGALPPAVQVKIDTLERATCIHPARSRTPGSEPKCIDCGKRLKAGVWV